MFLLKASIEAVFRFEDTMTVQNRLHFQLSLAVLLCFFVCFFELFLCVCLFLSFSLQRRIRASMFVCLVLFYLNLNYYTGAREGNTKRNGGNKCIFCDSFALHRKLNFERFVDVFIQTEFCAKEITRLTFYFYLFFKKKKESKSLFPAVC